MELLAPTALRRLGAFFTPRSIGDELSSLLNGIQEAEFATFDPACGAGDLLLAVAARLAVKKTVSETMIAWSRRLLGCDVSEEFVRAARLRLVLAAVTRGADLDGKPEVLAGLLTGIGVGDGLKVVGKYRMATHVVMNPPFVVADVKADLSWRKGQVTAAALFLERAVTRTRPGTQIVALLPEVLRTGTSYARWREHVAGLADLDAQRSLGLFSKDADVDVFLQAMTVRGPHSAKPARSLQKPRTTCIGSRFKISVGPVVPKRHPEVGPEVAYLHAGNATAWKELARISERRRFSGPLVRPPFIVIRRTSRPESITVTKPTVTTAQNGPNSADVEVTYFDIYARPIWHKDGEGFLHYTEYDQATGAVKKSIRDVDSTITADFSNKPAGWTTPGTGGLHLKTLMDIDGLGRATKITDPVGNVTYLVYKDTNYEVRTYAGWNTGTNAPTGPTVVQRYDRPGSYLETLTMSATPALDGSNLPTGTESIGSIQSLSRQYLNNAGQMTRRDDYHSLSGVTYATTQYIGTLNTHYYTTTVDYTHRGWQNRVVSPTGTISRTVYDVLGRVISTWVGTNDTPGSGFWSPTNNTSPSNMVKVSEYEYDAAGVGDSNLTKLTQIPGGGASNRVTQMYYDFRNRQVATKQGVEGSEGTSLNRGIFYTEFDNLSQAIAQEQYDGDNVTISDGNSDGVPDKPSSSLLRARTVTSFDEQGRVYRTQVFSVNQSNGTVSSDALTTNMWFDRRGLVLKTSQPGGLVSKSLFDGAGRTKKSYSTDGGGDSGYSDADDVTGDKVLEQVEYTYDKNGNVELVTTRQRFHDETGTGELGTVSTGNKARVSYVAMYYDKANRLTDTVNEGTNGASAYTRPGSVPSRTDTELVTSNTYDAAGRVSIVTDPRAIELRITYDLLGRRTKTIEAYVDGTPSTTDDKTTEFTYDGSGHLLTLKALLTGSDYQETKWVYGVTTGGGSGITSNDVLAEMWYPNKSTGAASSSEKEIYTVNALGESLTKTDRNGNVHTFSYDVVGRMTTDAVTTLGSGVDGAVRRLETAYDTGGRAYLFTSYDASSAGNVVNQVQRDYNGLGQLITEYQAHSGAVNTGSTPKVQYAYSEMASGANHSRITSMVYPNGRTITYRYSSLDSSVSRITDIRDGNDTLEAYSYLGLGTVVRRAQSQAGIELTYLKQGAEGDGEAGDKYAGLDRFGRIRDQRWLKTSDGTARDRFEYGYDRNSNRLYEKNLVDGAFSELYHANGASNGYDKLNQISEFRRGTLSDANSDGVPDTVTTASRSQVWTLDPLGNWSTVNNDGTAQNRTHNRQNQITSITSLTTPTYDANGNMTGDENGKTLVYDAWNRLVDFKNGGTSLEAYKHDALNRRIEENLGTARALFYTAEWQVIEERTSGVARVSMVWSPVYTDALIVRDRDSDTNGSLEERLYVAHDANWNVSSILNTSATVQERYVYDPFGTPSFKDASYGARGSSSYGWTVLHQGGRRSDQSTLFHFRNRELLDRIGSWNRNDPLHVRSNDQNLYRAYRGNPLAFVDSLKLLAYQLPDPGDADPSLDCGKDANAPVPPDIGHPPRPGIGYCYWSIGTFHEDKAFSCGGPWIHQEQHIEDLEEACERLRTGCNQKCNRLVISGHGMPPLGFGHLVQGCSLIPSRPPRLVISPELQRALRCLRTVLPGDAYVTMNACNGFPGNPPVAFGKCLKEFARLLGRKICACTRSAFVGMPDCRCRCTGKWCCAQP